MDYVPCHERTFLYRLSIETFYAPYLRWLRHLNERLGLQNTLSLWEKTFANYDDELVLDILSKEWQKIESGYPDQGPNHIEEIVTEHLKTTDLALSVTEIQNLVENTPPIAQIKQLFSLAIMEKEISAYNVLHLRFDGLAYLAEALIAEFGKQGELIVYDLMIESRLAASKNESGSVEEFIESFTAESDIPSLFTAGLEIELDRKSDREAKLYVRECEWARYFHERHPEVGYLMACSTDEVAYRAFNQRLRMQRTQTIMEGGGCCDFWIYAIDGY